MPRSSTERNRRWRERNRERVNELARKYREANPDRVRESYRRWYDSLSPERKEDLAERRRNQRRVARASDPEKYRAMARESYAKHREKRLASAREYNNSPKNKAASIERIRQWKKANPERAVEAAQRRWCAHRDAYDEIYARIVARAILRKQEIGAVGTVPKDLLEAKAAQLLTRRKIRDALK